MLMAPLHVDDDRPGGLTWTGRLLVLAQMHRG